MKDACSNTKQKQNVISTTEKDVKAKKEQQQLPR